MNQQSETEQRLKQIRERQAERAEWSYGKDIDFLLSLLDTRAPVDSQGETSSDDGSTEWCDDCHGHTHRYDCSSKRRERKTALVDQIVDAVYRSMARYEDGTWFLDNLRAKARVKQLLNNSDAATQMRTACVEKVKELRDGWQQKLDQSEEYSAVETVMSSRTYASDKIIVVLQSLVLDQAAGQETGKK